MRIDEICNRNIVTIASSDSILTAARVMRDEHVGCVVVVESDGARAVPVGLLTDRDIVVAVVALNLDAEEICVGDVMSADVHSIKSDETLGEALRVMRAEGVRRLPVIDAHGALTGIVSSDDVLQVLGDQLGGVAEIVGREQRRERDRRRVRV